MTHRFADDALTEYSTCVATRTTGRSGVPHDRRWGAKTSALLDARNIDRLNIGAMPTVQLNWLQPHEGSSVDFHFRAWA